MSQERVGRVVVKEQVGGRFVNFCSWRSVLDDAAVETAPSALGLGGGGVGGGLAGALAGGGLTAGGLARGTLTGNALAGGQGGVDRRLAAGLAGRGRNTRADDAPSRHLPGVGGGGAAASSIRDGLGGVGIGVGGGAAAAGGAGDGRGEGHLRQGVGAAGAGAVGGVGGLRDGAIGVGGGSGGEAQLRQFLGSVGQASSYGEPLTEGRPHVASRQVLARGGGVLAGGGLANGGSAMKAEPGGGLSTRDLLVGAGSGSGSGGIGGGGGGGTGASGGGSGSSMGGAGGGGGGVGGRDLGLGNNGMLGNSLPRSPAEHDSVPGAAAAAATALGGGGGGVVAGARRNGLVGGANGMLRADFAAMGARDLVLGMSEGQAVGREVGGTNYVEAGTDSNMEELMADMGPSALPSLPFAPSDRANLGGPAATAGGAAAAAATGMFPGNSSTQAGVLPGNSTADMWNIILLNKSLESALTKAMEEKWVLEEEREKLKRRVEKLEKEARESKSWVQPQLQRMENQVVILTGRALQLQDRNKKLQQEREEMEAELGRLRGLVDKAEAMRLEDGDGSGVGGRVAGAGDGGGSSGGGVGGGGDGGAPAGVVSAVRPQVRGNGEHSSAVGPQQEHFPGGGSERGKGAGTMMLAVQHALQQQQKEQRQQHQQLGHGGKGERLGGDEIFRVPADREGRRGSFPGIMSAGAGDAAAAAAPIATGPAAAGSASVGPGTPRSGQSGMGGAAADADLDASRAGEELKRLIGEALREAKVLTQMAQGPGPSSGQDPNLLQPGQVAASILNKLLAASSCTEHLGSVWDGGRGEDDQLGPKRLKRDETGP